MPSMRPDEDSVSTFHPGATINLADETDEEGVVPTITHATPSLTRILKTSRSTENDTISRISMSDSASRISSLEPEFSAMSKDFRDQLETHRESLARVNNDRDLSSDSCGSSEDNQGEPQ